MWLAIINNYVSNINIIRRLYCYFWRARVRVPERTEEDARLCLFLCGDGGERRFDLKPSRVVVCLCASRCGCFEWGKKTKALRSVILNDALRCVA